MARRAAELGIEQDERPREQYAELLLVPEATVDRLLRASGVPGDVAQVYLDYTTAGQVPRDATEADVSALLYHAKRLIAEAAGREDQATAGQRLQEAAEMWRFAEEDAKPRRLGAKPLLLLLRCCEARDRRAPQSDAPRFQSSEGLVVAESFWRRAGLRPGEEGAVEVNMQLLEHALLCQNRALGYEMVRVMGGATKVPIHLVAKLLDGTLSDAAAAGGAGGRDWHTAQQLLRSRPSGRLLGIFFRLAVRQGRVEWARWAADFIETAAGADLSTLRPLGLHYGMTAFLADGDAERAVALCLGILRVQGPLPPAPAPEHRGNPEYERHLGRGSGEKSRDWRIAICNSAWSGLFHATRLRGSAQHMDALLREYLAWRRQETQGAESPLLHTSVAHEAVSAFCSAGDDARGLLWAEHHWITRAVPQTDTPAKRVPLLGLQDETVWGPLLAAALPPPHGRGSAERLLRLHAHCCALAPPPDWSSHADKWRAVVDYCRETPWTERAEPPAEVCSGHGPISMLSEAWLRLERGDQQGAALAVRRVCALGRVYEREARRRAVARARNFGAVSDLTFIPIPTGTAERALGRRVLRSPRYGELRAVYEKLPLPILAAVVDALSARGVVHEALLLSRLAAGLQRALPDATLAAVVAAAAASSDHGLSDALTVFAAHSRVAAVSGPLAPAAAVRALSAAARGGAQQAAELLPTVLAQWIAQCASPPAGLLQEAAAAAAEAGCSDAAAAIGREALACGFVLEGSFAGGAAAAGAAGAAECAAAPG
eukprot:TRINITY_DN7711_c0_g1_i1.p1 TRINITY_DN7711_c0_g1~~TRINITY_DN7711_c0_g1_i1.p1  ORF type:complete len:864 (+),score=253.79 TRINITY_DN7711_c0_g1_i1:276-2594(+)